MVLVALKELKKLCTFNLFKHNCLYPKKVVALSVVEVKCLEK